jgi:hypothetical protein
MLIWIHPLYRAAQRSATRTILSAAFAGFAIASPLPAFAQAPAAAPATANVNQVGTVKSVAGNLVTITTDKGVSVTITVGDGARILRIAAGATNLKSAQPATLADIAAGDRVLATVKPDTALTAIRVVLTKSADIAQKRAADAADWQKRGSGGIVTAVTATSLTVTAGAKKITVQTTPTTIFRRYAGDSVKFEDAVPSTVAQIQPGDQMQVRGAKSDDGASITAEEIISGSFRNLSGTLAAVDPAAGTVTLKDLASKKNFTVKVTANSEVKNLPPQAASMFLARRAGGATGAPGPGSASPGSAGPGSAGPGSAGPGSAGPGGAYGARRPAGMDLSSMLARLPSASLADLHPGDVVMIVASSGQTPADPVTAVTLLSGVAPLLAATPSGGDPITLAPWSMGMPDAGGPGQ